MEDDLLDRILSQWKIARPDLDTSAMAIVGRILRLACHLEHDANQILNEFNLPIWAFDVLGALHRTGEPYALTPTQLMKAVMLSSGAVTHRVNRLEAQGLVARQTSLDDRRSMPVQLTPRGLELISTAEPVRFAQATSAVEGLTSAERATLAGLLRKMLLNIEPA